MLIPIGKNNEVNVELMSTISLNVSVNSAARGTSSNRTVSPSKYESPKRWRQADMTTLLRARSQDNPPSFRHIAEELNRFHDNIGSTVDRKFTAKHCSNKWYSLFPSQLDANRTVEYCASLKKCWPNFHYYTKAEACVDKTRAPKLLELHIVWPWCKDLVSISNSLFCDATFNVTVYDYKIVCVSTLDGNQQHRPLMTSFIAEDNGVAWRDIFNYLAEHVLVHDPPPMYVVTSDQEAAIKKGLRTSKLHESCLQFFCGVHAKWNVRDYKYVALAGTHHKSTLS